MRHRLGVAVTTTESSTPVKVQGLGDAVKIAAGGLETCVIRAGGSIACWGDNSSGQAGKRRGYCWGTNQHGLLGNGAAVLGDGSFVVSAVPVEVALP